MIAVIEHDVFRQHFNLFSIIVLAICFASVGAFVVTALWFALASLVKKGTKLAGKCFSWSLICVFPVLTVFTFLSVTGLVQDDTDADKLHSSSATLLRGRDWVTPCETPEGSTYVVVRPDAITTAVEGELTWETIDGECQTTLTYTYP